MMVQTLQSVPMNHKNPSFNSSVSSTISAKKGKSKKGNNYNSNNNHNRSYSLPPQHYLPDGRVVDFGNSSNSKPNFRRGGNRYNNNQNNGYGKKRATLKSTSDEIKQSTNELKNLLAGVEVPEPTLPNGKKPDFGNGPSRRPSGLRKTTLRPNSLAHRTTWLRSDFNELKNLLAGVEVPEPTLPNGKKPDFGNGPSRDSRDSKEGPSHRKNNSYNAIRALPSGQMPDFGGKSKSNRCRLPSPPSSSSSSNPYNSNYSSNAIDIDIPEIQSLPNGRKPDFGTGSGNSKKSQPHSQPSSPSSRFTKKCLFPQCTIGCFIA
ncbi:unnamed protein product [Ambrosiozyma monospora]|uniref:Unnamed protein product n=1 Tax=Ambrosiozyma monospora TaxID=43982 RepID=A0ACB5UC23_AMBMO|nr:unnamed protein product [Ambrosiozyma monospora]